MSAGIGETAKSAGRAENADIVKTDEIAESIDRYYRHFRPRMEDCMPRLKKTTRLPAGIAGTAETAA